MNYTEENQGYRWPAIKADSYAPQIYGGIFLKYCDSFIITYYYYHYCYFYTYIIPSGKNPQFVMGSLVAIPSWITEESLNLSTKAGQILFHAFQDYGAYVVGDSYQDVFQVFFQIIIYLLVWSIVNNDNRFVYKLVQI